MSDQTPPVPESGRSPRATITLTLADDGDVNLSVEFEPMADNKGGPNPITHHAALKGAEAIVAWLQSEEG